MHILMSHVEYHREYNKILHFCSNKTINSCLQGALHYTAESKTSENDPKTSRIMLGALDALGPPQFLLEHSLNKRGECELMLP